MSLRHRGHAVAVQLVDGAHHRPDLSLARLHWGAPSRVALGVRARRRRCRHRVVDAGTGRRRCRAAGTWLEYEVRPGRDADRGAVVITRDGGGQRARSSRSRDQGHGQEGRLGQRSHDQCSDPRPSRTGRRRSRSRSQAPSRRAARRRVLARAARPWCSGRPRSSASSMTSRPRRRSSTGMVHGGTTWMRLKCENGQTPFALQAATTSFIGRGGLAGRVERHERLPGLAVAHQLDGPEHAQAADLADGRVALLQLPQRRARSRRCPACGRARARPPP